MKTTDLATLNTEITTLATERVLVATNQGTYGSAEACRAIGTGDPKFANCDIYETVGGGRIVVGCSEDRAPGRMRHTNQATLAEKRKTLATLREQARKLSRKR